MLHLLNHPREQFEDWLRQHGLEGYRARQVWRWVFRERADRFQQMTDLPRALRARLNAHFQIFTARIAARRQADDGTEKLLLELADGERVECVLLGDDRRRTICISTQVGCAMGCAFCASGLDGLARNLTTGEILEQMLHLQRLLPAEKRISHIVVMGMGEPLANLDALLPALAAANRAHGLGISARRITVSTVGLPEGIRRLAAEGGQYHIAVSLHAPDDRLRSRLVPATRNFPLAEVLSATDEHFQRTGRRVTFEYVLLAEVNDRPTHARRLASLLQAREALINVIPYNPVRGLPYRTPSPATTAQFVEVLRQAGMRVKIRFRKGERIDAACGQLRRSR